jgi:hypothetical protein
MAKEWVPSSRQREHWMFPTLFIAALASLIVCYAGLAWRHWGSWSDAALSMTAVVSVGLMLGSFWQRIGMLLTEAEWIRTIMTDIIKEPGDEYPSVASLLAARRALGLSRKKNSD